MKNMNSKNGSQNKNNAATAEGSPERLVRHLSEAHAALKEARINLRMAVEAESAAEASMNELKNEYLEKTGEEWEDNFRCRECEEITEEPEFDDAGNGPFCSPCFLTYRSRHA